MNARRTSGATALIARTFLALLLMGCLGVLYREAHRGWWRYQPSPVASIDERTLQTMFRGNLPAARRYQALFEYFALGFVHHATPSFARVQYSGVGDNTGFRIDGLQGFARTAPLLAAWASTGRDTMLFDPRSGRTIDLVDALKRGLLAGVARRSPDYWGDIGDYDQRIVEAADIARFVWLTRTRVWDQLAPPDRQAVTSWLRMAGAAKTPRTNWMLFPVLVDLVLAKLSPADAQLRTRALQQFDDYRQFYLQSGWFYDRPYGVDFYNTWGITYELFWIHAVDPDFEKQFVTGAIHDSAALTEHLIGPRGVPIMGRSICYRTAIPVPIIAASLIDPSESAHASRALDLVWRYFIAHDSLRDGALTQGYFNTDLRFLENYLGTGSCQWGLRSLVLAFLWNKESSFWQDPSAPLPVELGDYALEYPKLGWRVCARRASGEIVIEIPKNRDRQYTAVPYTWMDRALEAVTRAAHRPSNGETKYGAYSYSSARPFVLPAATEASLSVPGGPGLY